MSEHEPLHPARSRRVHELVGGQHVDPDRFAWIRLEDGEGGAAGGMEDQVRPGRVEQPRSVRLGSLDEMEYGGIEPGHAARQGDADEARRPGDQYAPPVDQPAGALSGQGDLVASKAGVEGGRGNAGFAPPASPESEHGHSLSPLPRA